MNKIAITMGEPRGIGPEVIVKALFCSEIRHHCNPIVIGDIGVMKKAVQLTRLPLKVVSISDLSGSEPAMGRIEVIDIKADLSGKSAASAGSGRAVVEYIRKAVELALSKEVKAIVTGPISKESLKAAGYSWPGHTELLADLTKTKDFTMMFVSDRLKVLLSTIHVSLKDVPGIIDENLVLRTIEFAARGADMLNIKNPRIAVAGLNPHAGESGIFGKEETEAIIPAVQKAEDKGINVTGPHPPDVVFYKALKGDFDMVVCMYHDQGLIPFKMLAFETGVNVTVGLPVIRTSPDHGTAFDIAWKNMANPSSIIEAIKLAAKLEI
ncbi:MAG TPA: 4-hydroxythreonine-4-phosphate dehydrogenase PdxA [Nitrospirae bacterium]|nr:4-hydroxythreonine-4-phosphate dehydrogenase 2 [bacterium BMS3Abin10]GBE38853.1 4-hydroxythreonine-4-phosphate dehydrogenase 2 [bacterium BMS3Bbin08]HDK17472.1 4-hydroxythreonine-4-phosphate dehydrogenase PdxA [Nitrospirota bacterium]HDO25841.1 4-hydroxythreonine-4-phosphate dehydrogenase PdxA [Nitrospirota bacterium]